MNTNIFAHDFDGQTTLSPVGLIAIIVLGIALLIVPRKYAAIPMLVMACFVPPAQRIVVASLNFDLLRVMVLFGTVRIFVRNEWRQFKWHRLDYVFLVWVLVSLVTNTLLYASADALKYASGAAYDAVGMYFLFRIVIRDWKDLDEICRAVALLAPIIFIAFLVEHATRHNPFAFMGGVPEITDMRDGRLRCQGAFAHPILAGCFWACLLPLLVAQWWRRGMPRWLTIMGVCASLGIIILCASSTPVSAVLIGVPAFALYVWKKELKWVLLTLVLAGVGLQLMMSHPIWWLLAKVDVVGGSTGWYRYNVMQQAVNHINEWWLIGSSQGTAHWGFVDLTNMYVVEGLHGGIALLGLFIGIFFVGFRTVGQLIKNVSTTKYGKLMAWSLGVALLMHAANYIAVAYFGQIIVVWYMELAAIGSLGCLEEAQAVVARNRVKKFRGVSRGLAPVSRLIRAANTR